MKQYEVNFDGLVGPTHNYAGLSFGNVASTNNANAISSPRQAAKQGLKKAKSLSDLGLIQGVLAPQERPDILTLRRLGFTGSDATVLENAAKQAPEVFLACCSASSMWTANAATVSPSADTADGKVHFTPANLTNKFHRSLEPEVTGRILQATFADEKHFTHHAHLPDNEHFGDEGAANHTRLCTDYGHAGVELFVYGRYAFDGSKPAPKKYPARQTFEACKAIARLHGLSDENVVYIQQNPDVIDKAYSTTTLSLWVTRMYCSTTSKHSTTLTLLLMKIRQKFGDHPLHFVKVGTDQVSVDEAVKTYLFNTQIITLPNGEMAIIAPTECEENPSVSAYLDELKTLDTPIKHVRYYDVKQSMRNGGGPACLRLRVAMTEQEVAAVNQNTLIDDVQFDRLNTWVDKHYRDELRADDLRDPQLLIESRQALDELTQLLKLGSVYPFQQD